MDDYGDPLRTPEINRMEQEERIFQKRKRVTKNEQQLMNRIEELEHKCNKLMGGA